MAKKFFKTETPGNQSDCVTCRLRETCVSPKMRVMGEGRLGVLIIAQSPSLDEDSKGEYGWGKEASLLEKTIEDMGYDLRKDFWYTTVVGCRAPKNRAPTKQEVDCCKPRLDKTIEQLNPNSILLLGKVPFDAIVGLQISGRLLGATYNKFYGVQIPDQNMGRWLCPTYSVEELLSTKIYTDSGYESKPLYKRDVAIFNMWKTHIQDSIKPQRVVKIDYVSKCKITQDIDIAIDWIEEAFSWREVVFDIETTGLKCHAKGHRIVSVSISNGTVSYAFPFFEDVFFRKLWKRFMLSPVKKIAHNISYELQWTYGLLGYWFNEVYFDTMLSQHVINNNSPTGLKYVTYITTGIVGYDESAETYIKSPTKDEELYGNNAFNRIQEAPIEDLLLYNALDSLFTYIIYKGHVARINAFQMQGFTFLMESTLTLAKTSANGFRLDMRRLEEVKKELQDKIDQAKADIMSSVEVLLWDGEEEFNFDSSPQLGHLLYDILRLKPPFLTDGGKPSVDAEALEKLDCPLVAKILYQRKLKKLLGTYINQYGVEVVDGLIHSQFYLNSVVSYRSSCGNVNVQNLPKRDLEAKKLITSLVIPREGRKLIGYDYKAIEVGVNACYSRDKNLVSYVNDASKDMHRDGSMDVFMLTADQVTKSIRTGIKPAYIFPSFYGSYWKQTAPDCWDLAKENNLLPHLASKGIKDFASFEQRVKHAEEIMWGERFPEHAAWRKQQWLDYQKRGYVDTLDGFRLYGPMSRNLSFNSSPQGTAYHCLQWTMNQIQKEIEDRNLKSILIFEIHDALYLDAVPEEESLLDSLMYEYGVIKIKECFPWICVDFQIEKETAPVGSNWAELKEVGYIHA